MSHRALGRNGFSWSAVVARFFRSFPGDFDMGADSEVDIADTQADQL